VSITNAYVLSKQKDPLHYGAARQGLKFCPDCNDYRPIDEFRKRTRGGLDCYCKTHQAAREKASYEKHYEAHKDEINKRRREKYAQKEEQLELIPARKSKKCTCNDYRHCMECRNREKRAAFKQDRIPVYRLAAMQPAAQQAGD
jgi:hypothetical protein